MFDDLDSDGDLDLYVTGYGRNVLYRNEGKAGGYKFTDVTDEAGVNDDRFSAGCAFVDYDHDGDLDLYVANYCIVDFEKSTPCETNGVSGYCAPGQYKPVHDAFFVNDGNGKYKDAAAEVGVVLDDPGPKWGMGVVVVDYNDDGWPDIYVANDVSDNFLLENQKNGKLQHVALERGVAVSMDGTEQGSMGLSAEDYDRDGRFDIVVTNYHKQLNALYRQSEFGFSDEALGKGLGESTLPMVSWGTKLFDAEADGWLDLFIANGHLEDQIDQYDDSSEYLQNNQLFRNEKGKFIEVTQSSGPAFGEKRSSRGAAFGDIDNDGDIDVVVCNSRAAPSLLLNQRDNDNHWIRLTLRGKKDRYALGAKVTVYHGSTKQVAEVRSGDSYCGQNDLRLYFGLGDSTVVDKVEVRWRPNEVSTFEKLAVDRDHTLTQ